jgi:hypothetical protein
MRSYDYCHFEVALSMEVPEPDGDQDTTGVVLDSANDLRKQAAILVDEAVRQYKIAKAKENARQRHEFDVNQTLAKIERIKAKPESEWTVEEAALMRAHADKDFWRQYEGDDYMYQEEPERDHHFSMLRKFQDTRIAG